MRVSDRLSRKASRFFLAMYGILFLSAGGLSGGRLCLAIRALFLALGACLVGASFFAGRAGRRFRRFEWWVVRVGAACTTFLVCALALEAATRLYLHSKRENLEEAIRYSKPSFDDIAAPLRMIDIVRLSGNEGLVYELVPGCRGVFTGVPVKVNDRGERGPLYAYRKPEGTFRIVGVGDSTAFGWGVPEEDAYLGVLEQMLREQGYRCEVINLAVPSYNTAMEVEKLAVCGLRYDPDLIILSFSGNDVFLPNYLRTEEDLLDFRRSFFLDHVIRGRKLRFSRDGGALLGLRPTERLQQETQENVPPRYRYMVGEGGVKRALERLKRLAGENGLPVIVEHYVLNDARRDFIEDTCSELGFQTLDSRELLEGYAVADGHSFGELFWVTERDSHPSRLGHRLIAGALRDLILSREGLAPGD